MIPAHIRQGDRIAIVSPASVIEPQLVEGAAATLQALGYEPVIMPHALGRSGTYSGTADERFADISAALADRSVRAILCSRGGYGAVHLLERLDPLVAATACNPKWLIGFSDISALHALWYRHGIPSIHASMARQLSLGPDTVATGRLLSLLAGNPFAIEWTNNTGVPNRPGTVTAPLTGGNLAVLDALVSTPYDTLRPGNILFIEDIAEPVYKIERMLYRLALSGVLARIAGLVVGRFTEYRPDLNHASMEEMIRKMVDRYAFPVAFNAPIGHIGSDNMPVLHGATVTMTVKANHCVLQ